MCTYTSEYASDSNVCDNRRGKAGDNRRGYSRGKARDNRRGYNRDNKRDEGRGKFAAK